MERENMCQVHTDTSLLQCLFIFDGISSNDHKILKSVCESTFSVLDRFAGQLKLSFQSITNQHRQNLNYLRQIEIWSSELDGLLRSIKFLFLAVVAWFI